MSPCFWYILALLLAVTGHWFTAIGCVVIGVMWHRPE